MGDIPASLENHLVSPTVAHLGKPYRSLPSFCTQGNQSSEREYGRLMITFLVANLGLLPS